MSKATLILGESGSGKTASLRNMNPSKTLLIQVQSKPLPFRTKEWALFDKENNVTGNIIVSDDSDTIISIMYKTKRPIIVIDDFQYMLANEYMRRSGERGFDKFTEIGRHAWDVMEASSKLNEHVRVYIFAHTDTDDFGRVRMKTIGKLLNEKVTPEGKFTSVLRTAVRDGKYYFQTHNSGNDTIKTPMEMFEADFIDNDLAMFDRTLCDYYDIQQEQ